MVIELHFTIGRWAGDLCVEWNRHRRGIELPSNANRTARRERVTCSACLVALDEILECAPEIKSDLFPLAIGSRRADSESLWSRDVTLARARSNTKRGEIVGVHLYDLRSLRYHAERLRRESA